MPSVFPILLEPLLKTGRYRHMAQRDLALWERFLDAHAGEYEAAAYDVAVGGVQPTNPAATDAQVRGFQYATALKIDVILDVGRVWWIVEVRPEASVSALGAALIYALVVKREQLTPKAVRPMLVCEWLSPDMKWAADALMIRTEVV